MDDVELASRVKKELSEGLIVKNYKELCSILGLPYVAGRSKQLQLENLKRFFIYDRSGQKFIITKIIDNPIVKIDKRTEGNHVRYRDLIETLLLDHFKSENKACIKFTKLKLYEALGLVNNQYGLYRYQDQNRDNLLMELQEISKKAKLWHIENFYKRAESRLSSIINVALNSLVKRGTIKELKTEYVGKNEKSKPEIISDPEEIEMIKSFEKEAMCELHCTNLHEVLYNKDKSINFKKYTEIVNREIFRELGYAYVYRRQVIICTPDYLKKELPEDINFIKNELNQSVVVSLIKQAQHDFDNNRQNLRANKVKTIYPNDYVNIQKTLIYRLISINTLLGEEFIDKIRPFPEMDENETAYKEPELVPDPEIDMLFA